MGTNKMTWTAYVQQEGDDLVLPLPDEAMTQLGWKTGDILVWDVQENGTIILTRRLKWYQQLFRHIKEWRK